MGGMLVDDSVPGRLIVGDGERMLLDYVYAPTDAAVESPRPYALLYTRSGVAVSAYRPDDHVWHKGLSLAIAHVGAHNFWGGPTYVRGQGYVQLPNNGAQAHRAFAAVRSDGGVATVDEALAWISAEGEEVLDERRTLTVRLVGADAWALTWRSALRNTTTAPLPFGSPTTHGRDDAGYGGIFWRGPASFSGGELVGPHGVVGEAARGAASPWLSFVAPDRSAGVLALDAGTTGAAGAQGDAWFARSAEYAGLGPAPFFTDEVVVAPGDTLVLAAGFVVGSADIASVAHTVGGALVAELRSSAASSQAALDRPRPKESS